MTVSAFRATCAAPMPQVGIAGLQPRNDLLYRAPVSRNAPGRPETAHLTSGEQRARVSAFNGAEQNIPDRIQHCSRAHQEGQYPARPSSACVPLDVYS